MEWNGTQSGGDDRLEARRKLDATGSDGRNNPAMAAHLPILPGDLFPLPCMEFPSGRLPN
jgi:hypothetical protein